MSDLIERRAVIDALEKVAEMYPWRVPGDRDSYSQYNEAWQDALNRADSEIEALPSVQPKAQLSGEDATKDCISRQDAIDAIHCDIMVTGRLNAELVATTIGTFVDRIKALPSAQPEIVRCKDCMYWVAHDKRCVYLNHGFAPNMWCCHGRRADG